MALLHQPRLMSACVVCHANVRNPGHFQHQLSCFNNNLEKIDILGLAQCQHDYSHIVTKNELDDHELVSCEHVRSRLRLVASGLVKAIRERKTYEYDYQVNIIKAEQEKIRSDLQYGRGLVKQLQKQQLREMIEARKKAKDLEREINAANAWGLGQGKKRSAELEEKERIRLYFLKRKKEADKEATTLNVPPDQIDPNSFFEPSTFNPPFQDLKPLVHFKPQTIIVDLNRTADKFVQNVEIKKEKTDT